MFATTKNKIVTIFGSSQTQPNDPNYTFAYNVGKALAEKGFTICNGGYAGTMEASAKGAKDAGGFVMAVTMEENNWREPNKYSDIKEPQPELFSRIEHLIRYGSAYIVLKGGTGTLAELAMVWELVNKNFLEKRPIILADTFWEPIYHMFITNHDVNKFNDGSGKVSQASDFVTVTMDIPTIVKLCDGKKI